MTFRRIFSHRFASDHANYVGRAGEITYYDGVFYVHDGVTAGGEAVLASSGGSSGSASWSSITGKPTFATVATSGSYNDLTNTPAIPANLSDLTNDIDAITLTSIGQFGYATQSYVDTAVSGVTGGGGSADTGNITFSGNNMSSTDDEIRLRTLDLTQTGSYNLVAGVDYSTAVWDGGSVTFNNDTTQNLYDAIWALTNFSVIQLHVGSDTFTVTNAGSSTPGVPQGATLWVNENAPNGPLTVDSVDITINTGSETFIQVSGTDITLDAKDDLRMYSNDIFRLVNRSSTDSVEIITDDENNSYTWQFKSDGVLEIPGDIVVSGDITGQAGAGTLYLKPQIDSNTYIQLNNTVDSVISTEANLEIRTDVSNTAKSWLFGTDGTLALPGDYYIGNNKPAIIGNYGVNLRPSWNGAGTGPELSVTWNDGLSISPITNDHVTGSNKATPFFISGSDTSVSGRLPGDVWIDSGRNGLDDVNGAINIGRTWTDTINIGKAGVDTTITFADGTVQTTAYTGSSGGTALPADASGYLNNNGSGTLSWVPGNPSGAGMLPYNDVVVFSNTATSDWTEYTLSGTMDAFYDWNNTYTTITLTSQTAYGKEITPNTKTLWINDSKINSNDYLVIEFPSNPAVGDVFTRPTVNITETVNAGSFIVGETYTILDPGTTNWTSIGASYGGQGNSFVATGAGSGTGTATTTVGAKKVIFKPQSGTRAQTMNMGSTGPIVFGQGGTYDFLYVDLGGQNANNPLTWVYAGVINSIPTWYQFYF